VTGCICLSVCRPQVRALVDPSAVELDYVLWTDPDVVFLQDLDSCVLPKPHILSIGPDSDPVRFSSYPIYLPEPQITLWGDSAFF
jgi:hypothetical protein